MANNFIIDVLPMSPAPIGAHKCSTCGRVMRFVGLEPHPTASKSDLYTFACTCGALEIDHVIRH